MDENEIYEALGMTPPVSGEDADRAVVGQSPMTRADGEAPAGAASEQDPENVSDLDTTDAGGTENEEEEPEQDSPPKATDRTGKPKEEPSRDPKDAGNLAGQEARWQAMAQQMAARAVEEERARNQAEWNSFFASAGLKNSLAGGKPITSLEEFRQWKAAYDRARLEQELKEGKLTPEALDAVIAQHVASSRPQEDPSLPPTAQAAPQSAAAQVTQEQINAELAEIHRLDGSVNGLEDILKLETGGAFQDAVRRGHSFLDAFKLANFDRLQNQRQNEAAQRAAQAARNSARSKEHLRSSASKGGNGSVAVPGDVMEMYRMMMPNASEADITAHYNRMLKEMKK